MQMSVSGRLSSRLPVSLDGAARPPLVVFSHVRWTAPWQRLQQLMTRLADDFDVHVVEEPVFADAEPALMSAIHQNGVEVLTPRTKEFASGFHDSQLNAIAPLLAEFMASRGLKEPLVWLTTPMALPLVDALAPCAVVYDCMDDLAVASVVPPQLLAREHALMALADVVLTATPSLHEAREGRHPNLHFVPDAVAADHFAPERLDGDDPEAAVADEVHRGVSRPRLGCYGTVDQHLDFELLAALADRRPAWQIVVAGPVVEIDPATLPRRPNIVWAGPQRYETLPYLMAQWDVGLLPYVVFESTRALCPPQTLEFLAGGKPVVGTPLPDLVSLHGASVRFARDADGFVAAIDELLAEPEAERAARRARDRALVGRRSWDGTAAMVADMLLEFVPVLPLAAMPRPGVQPAFGASSQ